MEIEICETKVVKTKNPNPEASGLEAPPKPE